VYELVKIIKKKYDHAQFIYHNETHFFSKTECFGSSKSLSKDFGPPIAPSTLCGDCGSEVPFPDSASSSSRASPAEKK
jgi:hypothetical protein